MKISNIIVIGIFLIAMSGIGTASAREWAADKTFAESTDAQGGIEAYEIAESYGENGNPPSIDSAIIELIGGDDQ